MAKKQKSVADVTLKISDLKDILRLCMSTDPKTPVMIHGAPGIGKSDAVRQIGAEKKRPVIDLRMSLLNPVDLRGVPVAKDGITDWWAPAFLPKENDASKDAILFLDEINAAPPTVQASAYQLVLDRRVGEYRLPDGVDVVAAGNRAVDRAITYEMPSALRNRFAHYEVEADLDDWKDWAFNAGIREDIIAFLNYKPDRLFMFDPKEHVHNFPTPRSWSYCSRMLDKMSSLDRAQPILTGVLGQGVAYEAVGFFRVRGKIPNAENIVLKGDMKVKPPEKSEYLYAFSGALVGVAQRAPKKDTLKAAENLVNYATDVLPTEFCVLTMKDFARTDTFDSITDKLLQTNAWDKLLKKYGEMLIS